MNEYASIPHLRAGPRILEGEPVDVASWIRENLIISPAWFAGLFHRRHLIQRLAVRQIRSRYIGSVLGMAWAVLHPIFLLAVFTFVFSVVFKARWGVEVGNRSHFALILFSGLIVYNLAQHCLLNAPTLVIANPSYVSKVVFPLDVLPWVALVEGIFHAVIGFLVFFVMYFFVLGLPPVSSLFLPLVLAPLVLCLLGVMWFLSAVGVYLRDLTQIMGVVSLVMMFLSPIFYPVEAVPAHLRFILYANPLTVVLGQVRDVLFLGAMPSPYYLAVGMAVGGVVAWLGWSWFMVTKRGFGDVV